MTHGSPSVVAVKLGRRACAALLCDSTKPGLEIIVARPIELAPITGREQERGAASPELVFEELSSFRRRKREGLALFDAGHMMADANEMKGEIGRHVQG
jgi:hypothetical protein